ncbi:MAG: cytochrome c3 family protein [Bryobacteraceae bacterium]
MKKLIVILGLLIAIFGWAQKPPPPAVDEKLPLDPPEQPIAFNHKLHVSKGVACKNCHAIKDPGFQAGYPKEAVCMGCHAIIKTDSPQIQKLAEHAKAKTAVPWVKVYQVPEYVWFSHASHVEDAKFECATCHGPVAEREALFKEKPTNMHSCMSCHAQHKAPNGCDFCHNSQ